MAQWLCDENITIPAFNLFKEAGYTVKHIKSDFKKGGISDNAVMQFGRKHKLTVITSDFDDYRKMKSIQVKNTYGVWILSTSIPKEQIRLFSKAYKKINLKTREQRRNNKVIISENHISIIDCRKSNNLPTIYKV